LHHVTETTVAADLSKFVIFSIYFCLVWDSNQDWPPAVRFRCSCVYVIIIIIVRIYYGAAQPVLSSALQYNIVTVDNHQGYYSNKFSGGDRKQRVCECSWCGLEVSSKH